jgi:lipopolysaccharide export LptBFGC system permease protein LptF
MEQLIDPLIADLQSEYAAARREGRTWLAQWIRASAFVAFAKVVVWHEGQRLIDSLRTTSIGDRRVVIRVAGASAMAIAAVTLLLVAVPLIRWQLDSRFSRIAYLVPQALPIAIPVGAATGIVFGLGGRHRVRYARTAILPMALAGCVVSFAMVAWIAPTANQAFRMSVAGELARGRGLPELTLGELGLLVSRDAGARRDLLQSHEGAELRFNYQFRWAVSAATLVLAGFALSVTRLTTQGFTRWLIVGLALFGYYELMYFGRAAALNLALTPVAAAWLPNVVFMTLTATDAFCRRLSARERRT